MQPVSFPKAIDTAPEKVKNIAIYHLRGGSDIEFARDDNGRWVVFSDGKKVYPTNGEKSMEDFNKSLYDRICRDVQIGGEYNSLDDGFHDLLSNINVMYRLVKKKHQLGQYDHHELEEACLQIASVCARIWRDVT